MSGIWFTSDTHFDHAMVAGLRGFASKEKHDDVVQAYARRRIRGVNVLLSHFPYRGGGDHTAAERYSQYRLVDEGLWLLHGHTHTAKKHCGRQMHVGVDAWNLAPVSSNTIADLIAQEPATR